MTLKSDIDQLAADAVLMHQVVHGDATTTVTTAGGAVRSVAKLIADKDAEINVSAGGVLAQSVAQVGFATQQAIAAGNALSQVNVAVAQALNAAGTAGQYSTALAAIASQTAIVPAATASWYNGTAVAVHIYDARKDSDEGTWTERCQSASLYNELTTATGKWLGGFATALLAANSKSTTAVGDYYFNTTDKLFYSIASITGAPTSATAATGVQVWRGARKTTPKVLAIIVEAARVIVCDATDPTLPMWKVFAPQGASGSQIFSATSGLPHTCVHALNGYIYIGSVTYGYAWVDLIKDQGIAYTTTAGSRWINDVLANANSSSSYTDKSASQAPVIINANVRAIVATALPDAPIDPTRGLPVPTVAILTDGGVTVIKDDGTTSNKAFTFMANQDSISVSNGMLVGGNASSIVGYYTQKLRDITGATFAGTPIGSTVLAGRGGYAIPTKDALIYAKSAAKTGIYLHKENPSSPNAGMVADVTNVIPGCWQVGDSRGAWLADTVVETVSGTAVASSTFTGTGNLDGWTLDATATNNAGVNMFDATSGAASNVLATRLLTGLTIGKNYTISFNRAGAYNCTVNVTGIGYPAFSAIAGNYAYQFVATATSHTLQLLSSAGSTRAQFGAISIVECAADRSVKANPLKAFGLLTKAPVAAGSQLVAWSGFAAGTNYMEQEYSSSLDFGTGDFCMPVWINPSAAGQTSTIFSRAPAVLAGNGVALNLVGGVLQLGRSIAGAAFANTTFAYTPPVNTWTLVNLVRVAGVMALRVNGVQQATTIADTNNYTNAAAVFTVGVDNAHANSFVGAMALLRASATPASADQGAYRYETERKLFLPGAQCCIAGNSAGVVSPPSFDDLTEITSIVTSWGVTEFVGLQATNSYATTVGAPACISTKSGYKLLAGAAGTSLYKPSRLLAEELTRTLEQRKAFGSRLLKKTFVATAGQTDFDLGIAEVPVSVYQMGALKDEGAGAGLYAVSDSGFRKTIKLGTGATLNDRVTIFYTQNL